MIEALVISPGVIEFKTAKGHFVSIERDEVKKYKVNTMLHILFSDNHNDYKKKKIEKIEPIC